MLRLFFFNTMVIPDRDKQKPNPQATGLVIYLTKLFMIVQHRGVESFLASDFWTTRPAKVERKVSIIPC